MTPHDIIIAPIISELSMDQMEELKYTFRVYLKANKTEIKKAIEVLFNVKVEKVNTLRMPGKKKRVGNHYYKTGEWKKAVVTLKEGSEPIPFFEGL